MFNFIIINITFLILILLLDINSNKYYILMIDKEKKEADALKKVKELIKKDPTLSIICSRYEEQDLLRDDSIKDVVVVSLSDDIFGKSFYVYTDADTLDLLYVQGPHRYIEIVDFFEL